MMNSIRSTQSHRRLRGSLPRGFTLLESLMAAGILLGIVVAMTAAVSAGQQNAYAAHQRIAATIAAEDLLGRILADDYADIATWDGYSEAVGAMTCYDGSDLSQTFGGVGRSVAVTSELRDLTGLNVKVLGQNVRVTAVDADNRTLATIQTFVPQPAGDSIEVVK